MMSFSTEQFVFAKVSLAWFSIMNSTTHPPPLCRYLLNTFKQLKCPFDFIFMTSLIGISDSVLHEDCLACLTPISGQPHSCHVKISHHQHPDDSLLPTPELSLYFWTPVSSFSLYLLISLMQHPERRWRFETFKILPSHLIETLFVCLFSRLENSIF